MRRINPLAMLPIDLNLVTFSFLRHKDLGIVAPVSIEFKTLANKSFIWNESLKDEFKILNQPEEAKQVFLTNPAARLTKHLLSDNIGQQYVEEKMLLSLPPYDENKKERIAELVKLQEKGVFSAGIISLEELLGIGSLDLFILNSDVFNEHGIEAFKKGFIKASDCISLEFRSQPGKVEELFTKEGLLTLEAGYITIKEVFACRYNQDCKQLIQQKYNEMLRSNKSTSVSR